MSTNFQNHKLVKSDLQQTSIIMISSNNLNTQKQNNEVLYPRHHLVVLNWPLLPAKHVQCLYALGDMLPVRQFYLHSLGQPEKFIQIH